MIETSKSLLYRLISPLLRRFSKNKMFMILSSSTNFFFDYWNKYWMRDEGEWVETVEAWTDFLSIIASVDIPCNESLAAPHTLAEW